MKKLKALPTAKIQNMAGIKQKMPEKKILIVGVSLCLLLAFVLFLLSQSVTSQKAELTKEGEAIYSPVDGIIFEMLIPKGKNIRKGDALIHFDPAYIRSKAAEIQGYLQLFSENRHNAGTLKQIFKPLLADVFSGITQEIIQLSETEAKKLKELQEIVREHTKAQVAMRRPQSFIDGKPDPELVKKEQDLQKKHEEAEEHRSQIAHRRTEPLFQILIGRSHVEFTEERQVVVDDDRHDHQNGHVEHEHAPVGTVGLRRNRDEGDRAERRGEDADACRPPRYFRPALEELVGRIVLADEIDGYPASAGEDGDPLYLVSKRIATFWNKKEVYVSTPTLKGTSKIEREYNNSTMEEWCVP